MKRKTGFIIAVMFICAFLCSACQPYQYYGKHPEIYSVFGSAALGAALFYNVVGKLKIVETDSTGGYSSV